MKNKKEKILFFTNELAIMLKSGLTFTTAIEIILKEEKDKNFKEVLKKIHKNLIAGKSIFESFKNFDKIFGNTYLYMLKIGEVSGSVAERLEDISKSLEFDLANQKKLGGILVYPIVVISLTLIIVTFLLTFILPNFITIFEENQVELPLITRILLFISRNFHYILLFIIALILIIFFVNMYINNNKLKRIKKDKWLLNIRLFGELKKLSLSSDLYYSFSILLSVGIGIIESVEILYMNNNKLMRIQKDKYLLNIRLFGELRKLSLSSDLYHSFSILLSVGIGIIESVDILYMNNNNYYIKENLLEVKKSLLAGNNIATALKKLNLYDERFSILITAGEESGYLSENLLQISKILKQDFEYKLKKLMSLLEPLVVVFLGIIVAFVVVAIYLPILSIGDVFSQ